MAKFDPGMESMLDTFMFETGELLENLDEILMRTEQVESISDIEDDDINEIFRTMHTIKGSAAMMGLSNMSTLAHAVEDVFYIIRDKSYVNMDKPAMYALLFKSSDNLKNELENLSDDDVPLTNFSELIWDLHEFADFLKGAGGDKAGVQQESGGLPEGLFDDKESSDMLTYKVTYSDSCAMPSARAMVLIRKLGSCAEVCRTLPEDLDADNADDVIKSQGLYIKLITDDKDRTEKLLSGGMNVEDVEEIKKDGTQAPAEVPDGLIDGSENKDVLIYKVTYLESCAMPSARAMVLVKKLGAFAEILATVPADLDDDSADGIISENGLFVKFTAESKSEAERILSGGINVKSAVEIKLSAARANKPAAPGPAPRAEEKKAGDEPAEKAGAPEEKTTEAQKAPAAEKPKAADKKPAAKKEQSMLMVRLEKLDRLLDLVSEIVITEGAVTSSPDLREHTGNLDRFNKSARDLKKLTDELQDVVMSLRMVPVSTAFQKMNRVVRDMNTTLKKDAKLIFVGEDTEVDKAIIDILGDPLMHIVRNAVDHGIETPEERQKAGKLRPATVTLSAGYQSNEVVISCKDNGAGMDTSKIMAKAKKNGLLTKPEGEYTDKEIFNFVLAPGFSTNEEVTQYSGRGVGMDVVKKNLEKVGGKLTVNSKLGKGSTFTIRIPLSLSIIDVLSVSVGGSSLSIPAAAVREAFSCKKENHITDPEGNEFVYLRDKCLPLIRLSQRLEIETEYTEPENAICIYCKDGSHEAVLMADYMICDQQVVVRPFSPLLDGLHLKEKGLAGCSILGDGSITMTLDIGTVIAGEEHTEEEGGANG
ncbi:MAG: chemotaxis protein CheA [Ruminococcus sp.]|nr:chemotaxis protein CheA [Ruminococcus sp.]